LPCHPGPPGSQRQLGRDFAHSRLRASHHQVGDVHASDEENEDHTRPQHIECGSNITDQVVLCRRDLGAVLSIGQQSSGVGLRPLFYECSVQRLVLCSSLFNGCAGAQPRQELEVVAVPILEAPLLFGEGDGKEQAHVLTAHHPEVLGQHPHHGKRLTIDPELAAQNVRILPEVLLPITVSKNHTLMVPDVHLLLGEPAPERRIDTEQP
jgi:hypothetical protein